MNETETVPTEVDEIYSEIDGLYTSDMVLGVMLTLCGTVGLLSNTATLFYFISRPDKSVHDLIYLLISAMDCITSICAFPIASSLFLRRATGIFGNSGFCSLWTVAILFTLRMSMFLVVIMSVVRTIVITKPNYSIRSKTVIFAVAVYALWLLLVDTTFLALGFLYIHYIFTLSSCNFDYHKESDLTWSTYFWFGSIQLEVMLPPFVAFSAFAISTGSLLKRRRQRNNYDKKFRQASITISLFTAVFLFCNIPCFLYQLAQLVEIIWPNSITYKIIWETKSILYYIGRLWLQMFQIFLNAALNPCLYLWRMPRFRNWLLKQLFKWRTKKVVN